MSNKFVNLSDSTPTDDKIVQPLQSGVTAATTATIIQPTPPPSTEQHIPQTQLGPHFVDIPNNGHLHPNRDNYN